MIHVISTSANIEDNYEQRKQQYLTGLQSIIKYYNQNPFIIECAKSTNYLAEHFTGHSQYSRNKGVNEFLNVKEFFSKFDNKFNDNDHIIKSTLRYEINSSHLIEQINLNDYDVFCKYSEDIYPGSGTSSVHCFLISMKYKCWKEFLQNFNTNVADTHPIEIQFANFAKGKNTKYLDKLGIFAQPESEKKIFNT